MEENTADNELTARQICNIATDGLWAYSRWALTADVRVLTAHDRLNVGYGRIADHQMFAVCLRAPQL